MKIFFIILLLFSFDLKASENVFGLDCNNQKALSGFEEYVTSKLKSFGNVKEYRDSSLMIKNITNFVPDDKFLKDDNVIMAQYILMKKINEGIKDYKICKNNNIYMFIYEKNLATYVDFFSPEKIIYSIDF